MEPRDTTDLVARLTRLLDSDPAEAVRQARRVDVANAGGSRLDLMHVRAAFLVDGGVGSQQPDAIAEGVALFRELRAARPSRQVEYNLANGLLGMAGSPKETDWLDHHEQHRQTRAEARRLLWNVAEERRRGDSLGSQALTNLANLLTSTYRLSEAQDARLSALEMDPKNGVAAGLAASDLLWLYENGVGSDLARTEAGLLARTAKKHRLRVREYAGAAAEAKLSSLADMVGDISPHARHQDPFLRWVEDKRLTLAPTVELVAPEMGKIDWLMLPPILEREENQVAPPPLFAMFNLLKADFILARDLAWRAEGRDAWPKTGRFADTLDYASYGPDTSALVLAHRTALDLLDKVAVTANHYFQFGVQPRAVSFGKLWRTGKRGASGTLRPAVEAMVRNGVYALYGLVELASDYAEPDGILHSQKELRNTATHRFIALHDLTLEDRVRTAPELGRHDREEFEKHTHDALRVARSAIQLLALAIHQREKLLRAQHNGPLGPLHVPDHDWVRGDS